MAFAWDWFGFVGEQEVWCGWGEVCDDLIVACGTRRDDLAGYDVCIDDWEAVWW